MGACGFLGDICWLCRGEATGGKERRQRSDRRHRHRSCLPARGEQRAFHVEGRRPSLIRCLLLLKWVSEEAGKCLQPRQNNSPANVTTPNRAALLTATPWLCLVCTPGACWRSPRRHECHPSRPAWRSLSRGDGYGNGPRALSSPASLFIHLPIVLPNSTMSSNMSPPPF